MYRCFFKTILIFALVITAAMSGCIKPDNVLTKGIAGVDDQIIFATSAPDNILIYSVGQAKMLHTLPADERLNDMVVNKAGTIAYVVTKNGWLNVFNLQRGDRIARVRIGTILQSVALSPDEEVIAVGVGSEEDYNAHDISFRSTSNIYREILRLPLRGDIQDLVSNPNPAYPEFYIINTNADKVRVFNFHSMELTGIITLGGSPSTLSVTPDGEKVYATLNARSAVLVIDSQTREIITRHELTGAAPHYLAFSQDGKTAAVTDREMYRVYFIDNSADEIIGYKLFPENLAYSIYPEIIAFSGNADYLYVISGHNSNLRVIDIRTMEMVQNYSLSKAPGAMHVIWGSGKEA